MKRAVIIILCLIAVGSILYPATETAYFIGSYELTVEIDTDLANDVKQISYLGADSLENAESYLTMLSDLKNSMEYRDSTEQFVIDVNFTFHQSKFGPPKRDRQEYSHLLVVLGYGDGSTSTHRVEIPHRSQSRRVVVSSANPVL